MLSVLCLYKNGIKHFRTDTPYKQWTIELISGIGGIRGKKCMCGGGSKEGDKVADFSWQF